MIYAAYQTCFYLRLPKVTPEHILDFKKAERSPYKKEMTDSEENNIVRN